MCLRAPAEDGFSLVESLVACAILAGAMMAVAQLFALAAAVSAQGRDTTRAAWLAAQKIEQLLASSNAPLAGGSDAVALYQRRWAIEPVAGHPDLFLLDVTVSAARGTDAARLATVVRREAP